MGNEVEARIKEEIWDWLHSDEKLTDFKVRMEREYGDALDRYLITIRTDPERRNILSQLVYECLTQGDEE